MKRNVLILIVCFLANIANGQVSTQGRFFNKILQANSGPQSLRVEKNNFLLKKIDNAAELLRAEVISKQCADCKRDFYGTGIDVEIDIKGQEYRDLAEGRLWMITVASPGAFAMQFYFDDYNVPPGSELYFQNDAGSMALGSFGNHNNHEDRKFATQTIIGDKVNIYYLEPNGVPFSGSLKIGKVIHAFKNIYKSGFGSSQSCNIDINCPDGSSYQDVKRAVSRISFYDEDNDLAAHCSGSLINTTSNSRKPYLLTANHCATAPAGSENDLGYRYWQWIFEFNYELFLCGGSVEPTSNSVQGATLLTKGAESDYALLNISAIPSSYNVFFLGWDARYDTPTKSVAIHHPNGDVKKISFDNEAPVLVRTEPKPENPRAFSEVDGFPKTDLKVLWNKGVTEGGSSGSPLLNQDKRIVGQLRGGSSECGKTEADYFGRLAISMNTPDPEYGVLTLKSFLDDNNTGATNWASDDPAAGSNGTFKVNSIELTSNRWEEIPKLFGRISYAGDVRNLNYSWAPAEDFVDAHAGVGILSFGGKKPVLPLTKQYTLTVTTPDGKIGTQIVTITLYDCENKNIYLDLCSEKTSTLGFESGSNESYQWSPATNLSSATVSNPVFTPPAKGIYEYTLVATSGTCTRTEKYNLTVVGIAELPAFTPEKVKEIAINPGSLIFNNHMGSLKASDGSYLVLSGDHMLSKLDGNNVLWTKKITNRTSRGFTIDLVEVAGGYMILSGAPNGAGSSRYMTTLIKVDTEGNVLWEKDHPSSTATESHLLGHIMKLSNGDVIVVGTYYNYNSGATLKQCPLYGRFDSNGNKIYFKTMPFTVNGAYVSYSATSAIVNSSDVLLLMADRMLIKINGITGNLMSTKGHTLTTKYTDTDGFVTYSNLIDKMTWAHDGNIIGSGSGTNPANNTIDARVVKFDENCTPIWNKFFGGSASEWYTPTVIPTTDGGYLMGTTSPSPANGNKSQPSWNGTDDYWVVKLDVNGNKLGDARYGTTKPDYFGALIDVGQANYLVAGYSQFMISGDRTAANGGTSDTDVWIMKIKDTDSPSANPTPQIQYVCSSSGPTFNNTNDPYRNEIVIVGECPAPVNFESGSVTSIRASEKVVIKAGVTIKSGASMHVRIGAVNVDPCDEDYIPNSSLGDDSEVLDVRAISEEELAALQAAGETGIAFYPNPSTGQVRISAQLNEPDDVDLTIANMLGVVVYTRHYENVSAVDDMLDLSELNDGVYTTSVKSSGGVVNKKIIIAK